MLAHLQATIDALSKVQQVDVDHALELLLACHNRGGIVYICGNGGSAATASHFACDLQKAAGVRAIALTDNVPLITALSNDIDYTFSLSEQLRVLANRTRDMAFVLSCSGASVNVWRVIEITVNNSMSCVALFGAGLAWRERVIKPDCIVRVDSSDYGVIENVHLAICHALTVGLRERLTNEHNNIG